MTIKDYLIDKCFTLSMFFISVLSSSALLWLLEIRFIFICFFEMLFLVTFIGDFLWEYFRRKNYYNYLWNIFDQLDEKTLLAELIEYPNFLDGTILYQIISSTNKYMNDRLELAAIANQEYREYVEMWVHEIKTPLTSAHLMIENDKNITTLRIEDELRNVERYVEQALYYAKSTALEKDFKVEKTTLKALVQEVVRTYSKSIIQVKGQVFFENLEIEVLADRKWCEFIIGQMIANSIKYSINNLKLTFCGNTYEEGCYLFIMDNGIGIPETDVPRIFDKGFTGENNRNYKKSTGIGLYLCKKLCQKMNMCVSVEPVCQEGTTMKITFPKHRF